MEFEIEPRGAAGVARGLETWTFHPRDSRLGQERTTTTKADRGAQGQRERPPSSSLQLVPVHHSSPASFTLIAPPCASTQPTHPEHERKRRRQRAVAESRSRQKGARQPLKRGGQAGGRWPCCCSSIDLREERGEERGGAGKSATSRSHLSPHQLSPQPSATNIDVAPFSLDSSLQSRPQISLPTALMYTYTFIFLYTLPSTPP